MIYRYGILIFHALASASALNLRRSLADSTHCVASHSLDACQVDGPKPSCTPYKSIDYCGLNYSFPTLIRERRKFVDDHSSDLSANGWWFQHLDDKLAGYALIAGQGYNAPQMYFCSSDVLGGLDAFVASRSNGTQAGGFVIRATNLHSSKGVYVLPEGFGEQGAGGIELLRQHIMTLEDIKTDMTTQGADKFVVEEFVHTQDLTLPSEYKFHMFNGEIGSINIVNGRGTTCECWAEVDADGITRLDQHGCFVPGENQHSTGECNTIDFNAGKKKAYPVKGFELCSAVPFIEPCILHDMKELARNISMEVGVYIRIDFFVGSNGRFWLQEFSTNHLNGVKHCSARVDKNNCVDSCYQGRMWNNMSDTEGGKHILGGFKTPIPDTLMSFLAAGSDFDSQCKHAMSLFPGQIPSTCTPLLPAPLIPETGAPTASEVPSESPSDFPSTLRLSGAAETWMTGANSLPPSIPINSTICPLEDPEGQNCTALPELMSCFYDEKCCGPDRCEYSRSCECVNGTFTCVTQPTPYCPMTCPPKPPQNGDRCFFNYDFFLCGYNEHCCTANGPCFVAKSCSCPTDTFECFEVNVTAICAPF